MDAETPTPDHPAVSRFIPLTRQAVIADLCHDPAVANDRPAFAQLALHLQRHRSHGYRALAEEMRRCYLPFSPDRDTLRVIKFTDDETAAMKAQLSRLTTHLLERANYSPIDTETLNALLNEKSPYSLRISVDLGEYDELLLFRRETYSLTHSVRTAETFFLKRSYETRNYRRLFILLKLKPDEARAAEIAKAENMSHEKALKTVRKRRRQLPPKTSSDFIYMKVFKDIPEHDIEMLFPLRRVEFRPFDKMKFYATAGGGTAFGVFSTTGKILAASNPITAVGALVGFIGLLARQIATFFNQHTRYMMELAQRLFFHNLANNRAALTLLLDRAEEEDVKEDLIALYYNAGARVPLSELPVRKARIDDIIKARYGVAVDFELDDAVSRLKADGTVREDGDTLVFATLSEAAAIYARLIAEDDRDDARHICDDAPPLDTIEV